MEHNVIPAGEIHAPHQWEYADATARTAAVITDAAEIGKWALQLSDGTYWRLTAVSPATWAQVVGGGGGGGGSTEVTHTLSTVPGYGVVPSQTVADYTALDAVSTNDIWVEVTVGGSGGVELFYREGGILRGPFGAWVKNAKYTFGDNNEDVLIVAVTPPTRITNTSSRFVAPSSEVASDPAFRVLRTGACVPIHITTNAGKVINACSGAGDWVVLVDCGGTNAGINKLLPVLNPSDTAVVIPGRGASITTVLNGGAVVYDMAQYPGFSGLPSRYAPSATNYGNYLSSWASSSTGVLEWDYAAIPADPIAAHEAAADPHDQYVLAASAITAVTYTAGGTTTIALDGRCEHFTATAATGATTWAITGAPAGQTTGFILDLTNGGSQTQNWPAGSDFDGGVAPTLTAAGKDRLVFQWDGSVWSIALALKDYR